METDMRRGRRQGARVVGIATRGEHARRQPVVVEIVEEPGAAALHQGVGN